MSILGNRVQRREDPAFLTGGDHYLENIPVDGALRVVYVRSTVAHARIAAVDTDAAREAPGVVAVFTAADIDLAPLPPAMETMNQAMTRPWLADAVVRFVGEAVAAVVAESWAEAVDAAELVFVDYEPLEAVVDPWAALAGDAVLFPEAGTNVVCEMSIPESGPSDDLFAGCDVVVRAAFDNHRLAPCPLEVQAAASRWEPDGRLTHWSSTQTPHMVKGALMAAYGLDPEQVRVVAPDVGGGFGAKFGSYPEALLLPWIAHRLGRPVRWAETRSESMVALGHGRAQLQEVELGGTRDGQVLAYRLTALQDSGAYPLIGAALTGFTALMTSGVYAIPKVEFSSRSVVTTTNPIVAYRGAGRPEACAALERAMDLYAGEIGQDPTEVRRRNFIRPEQFPFTTAVGTVYDSGDYERALDLLLEAAGYERLRKEQAKRRAEGGARQIGIGVATYVEITSPVPGGEFGAVEITTEGRAVVRTGSSPHGQGHATAFAMVASEYLGLPMGAIDVVHGDTDEVPSGVGTFGSRSLQLGGSAVRLASEQVVAAAKDLAAQLLEANPDDIVLSSGAFHVAGTPAVTRSWAEVAADAGPDGLTAELTYEERGPTFPFGAHLAVVSVDTETGGVELLRFVAVDDAGRIVNPLLAEGQVHGGIAQGVAQALYEQFRYDGDGNPLTTNLADYAMVSAAELPSFELVSCETPTDRNELGVKGIGESGTIGSTPAVWNAVIDAVSHLGVTHLDIPTTPERIWRAIEAARTT
ncbi:MAG: xanthine dehydrogenase family protein molybdopterin-binding subunit [Actinomycetota bacterium]